MNHSNQPIESIPEHLAGDEQVIVYVQNGVAKVKVSDKPLEFIGGLEREDGDGLTVVFGESLLADTVPHIREIVKNVDGVEKLGRQAILRALLQRMPSAMAA